MSERDYEKLKSELPTIAKLVGQFPEALQRGVFEVLHAALMGQAALTLTPIEQGKSEPKELANIATLDAHGNFQFVGKDIKAGSTNDAARRIAYVCIRVHQQLSGNTKTPWKAVVLPTLRNWNADTSNTRRVLARDKGLLREGDEARLAPYAEQEADKFIAQMLDDQMQGLWKPGAAKRKRKGKAAAKPGGPKQARAPKKAK